MRRSILLFSLLFLMACQQQEKAPAETTANLPDFTVFTSDNPELKYENLQLFPIVAEEEFIQVNAVAANFKNLKEAMANDRFRITEKKPFGRSDDMGAVNSLTVQNKSQDTVFIMSGDVVQGGRQDRIIAMDMVIPPRTITDIPVFCVEQNRWNYVENNEIVDDHQAQQNKKIYAFTGYYNVASHDLRKTITQSGNQQAVWEKVSQITATNKANTSTGTYTALEQSEDFTALRDKYLRFFEGKLQDENIIGVIAVSGDKIMGADIFAHPKLFQKQFSALIHSYITDAITNGSKVKVDEQQMDAYTLDLIKDYQQPKPNAKCNFEGALVHYSKL